MLITPDQIRAARALKNWSQSELAQRVDMATPSIGNIEAGKHTPTPQTQNAIIEAFEGAGIEFINGGVRFRQDLVRVYEGNDCYIRLLDDAFLALSAQKGEILFSGSDEHRSSPEVIEKFRAMRRSDIHMRSLVKPGDTHLMGKINEYRWMPESLYEDSDVKVIFDDTVAYLVSWQDVWKVIIVKDETIANEARRLFEFIWDLSEKPKKSTAAILYEGAE